MSTKKKSFLIKLRQMVNYNEGIRWNPSGLVIEVFDKNLLQQAILKYFRTNKVATFHRQLTYYQFYTFVHQDGHRVYKNTNFIRDNTELEANIIRNNRKNMSGLFEDDLNHLFKENKKQMKQLKEIQKKQLYLISNLQIQTKIHIQLSKTIQNVALSIENKFQMDGGDKFGDQFCLFISGLKPDLSAKILQEIFGSEFIGFSPIPFQYR